MVSLPGLILVRQANPFSPLMFMAQEPQIPSRHDLETDRTNTALPSEGKRRVGVVLDLEQSIQNHRSTTRYYSQLNERTCLHQQHIAPSLVSYRPQDDNGKHQTAYKMAKQ